MAGDGFVLITPKCPADNTGVDTGSPGDSTISGDIALGYLSNKHPDMVKYRGGRHILIVYPLIWVNLVVVFG